MSDQDTGFDFEAAIAQLFGWNEHWIGDDPWGSLRAYHAWLTTTWKPEIDRCVFLSTVLTRGSTYLARLVLGHIVATTNFTKLPSRTILSMLELAWFVEDCIRRQGVPLRGEGEWLINYEKPLHPAYIAYLLTREYPFRSLANDTLRIMAGRLALQEEVRRGPAVFDLANYIVSESPSLQNRVKEIAPNAALPDKDRAFEVLWGRLEEKLYTPKSSEGTAQAMESTFELLKKATTDAFEETPSANTTDLAIGAEGEADIEWEVNARLFWAKVDPEILAKWPNSEARREAEVQRRVRQRRSQLKGLGRLTDIQAAAIDGKLAHYFSKVARRDRQDDKRKERRTGKRATSHREELQGPDPLDSDLAVLAYDQWVQNGRPDPGLEQVNPVDLKGLGLPIDQLTPGEQQVLQEVLRADELGYSRSSKTGKSYRHFWGADYGKKVKMLERAKAKLQAAMPTLKKERQTEG